ncbi:unnamed protein product [Gongylonema pulchrum]|uniref:Uncharacterized protein n=1 Tax=Gongylonema pulchrum TaxID=637853 RepID=A0A3P7NN03_9BILA|nr:unnamed protein product [Gongylonema pulchrum]
MQCRFKPDVYMLSILLTFGTFTLTYGLNMFRRTPYFGSTGLLIVLYSINAFAQ